MAELTREQILTAVISGRGPAYLRGADLSGLNLSGAGWLCEADLRYANLSGANLSKANLSGANLEGANLHQSNLTGTNLEGADLGETKLNVANARQANLSGARLKGARLVGADLSKANLSSANLQETDLEGASLEGADLTHAKLDLSNLKMTKLHNANLQGASLRGTLLDKTTGGPEGFVIPTQGFAGVIHCVQLTDLVQMTSLARADLLIQVESALRRGVIHVRSGRVRHAQIGDVQGEAALFQMLQWDNGRFETLPLPPSSAQSIDKPVEHLLVESMRQRDEKKEGPLGKA